MIIFYEKQTGNIIGTIDGRVHNSQQMSMWIGDPEDTARAVFDWEKKESGWEPKKQKEIIEALDRGEETLKNYRINSQGFLEKNS